MTKPEPSAFDTQVGGGHYKGGGIQPIEFIAANNLNYFQGCVIKYIYRYKNKGGPEDLRKAKHYIDLLLELEYQSTEYETPTTESREGYELRVGHENESSLRVPTSPEVRSPEGFFWGVHQGSNE